MKVRAHPVAHLTRDLAVCQHHVDFVDALTEVKGMLIGTRDNATKVADRVPAQPPEGTCLRPPNRIVVISVRSREIMQPL